MKRQNSDIVIAFTCITQGMPRRNSAKHNKPVSSSFLLLNKRGNSSTKALVIVSNIPNWKYRGNENSTGIYIIRHKTVLDKESG